MLSSIPTGVFKATPVRRKTSIICHGNKQRRTQDSTTWKSICSTLFHSCMISKQTNLVCSSGKRLPTAVANVQNVVESNDESGEENIRRLAHFSADIWGDSFLNFSAEDTLRLEKYGAEVEPLKEQVRKWLVDDSVDVSTKLNLIDVVERLGVYYYYESEIETSLLKIYQEFTKNNFENHRFDLCDTATHFRVLRGHGYKVPSDIFMKFTNGEGKFKESLHSDIRGVLRLYEAAHVSIHGDDILDEAILFAKSILESASKSSKQVRYALKQAYHYGSPRDECRQYISFYEEDDHRDETLLRFAKIEFNRLQLIHRQELSEITRWWCAFDFKKKLPYARQRHVENLQFVITIYFEPQYSFARVLLTKLMLVVSVLDDTYDAYGTSQELELLTKAFERWDMKAMEQLPKEYMKVVYDFVLSTFVEFSIEMNKRGKPFAAEFTKDRVVDIVRSFNNEAKWLKEGHMPTFDEYYENAKITVAVQLTITASMMGMDEITEEMPFQLIVQSPKCILACQVIGRLVNDLAGHEEKGARGGLASSVGCYMRTYNKSKEETVQILRKMVKDAWKEMNEELLVEENSNVADFPRPVVIRVLNFCRVIDVIYRGNVDAYTHSSKDLEEVVLLTFVEPFAV